MTLEVWSFITMRNCTARTEPSELFSLHCDDESMSKQRAKRARDVPCWIKTQAATESSEYKQKRRRRRKKKLNTMSQTTTKERQKRVREEIFTGTERAQRSPFTTCALSTTRKFNSLEISFAFCVRFFAAWNLCRKEPTTTARVQIPSHLQWWRWCTDQLLFAGSTGAFATCRRSSRFHSCSRRKKKPWVCCSFSLWRILSFFFLCFLWDYTTRKLRV